MDIFNEASVFQMRHRLNFRTKFSPWQARLALGNLYINSVIFMYISLDACSQAKTIALFLK